MKIQFEVPQPLKDKELVCAMWLGLALVLIFVSISMMGCTPNESNYRKVDLDSEVSFSVFKPTNQYLRYVIKIEEMKGLTLNLLTRENLPVIQYHIITTTTTYGAMVETLTPVEPFNRYNLLPGTMLLNLGVIEQQGELQERVLEIIPLRRHEERVLRLSINRVRCRVRIPSELVGPFFIVLQYGIGAQQDTEVSLAPADWSKYVTIESQSSLQKTTWGAQKKIR